MRSNRLRELLDSGMTTLGTHLHSVWPGMVEAVGHTKEFDYVEFQAEYAPFDLESLDNFCRAAELHNLGSMIKIDFEPRRFLAQRAIGAGFESVLFADCRTADDARNCVQVVRPDTPTDAGEHGAANRRFSYMRYAGNAEYVQALRDVVIVLMIEKKEAVENLEEILSVPGIDMIQWGPGDYSMSVGMPGGAQSKAIRDVEMRVLERSMEMGIPPRVEMSDINELDRYAKLGVKHFCIGTDLQIVYEWLCSNGRELRRRMASETA